MDLLLIAQSARMLAQSAARAGFRVSTIDFYGDEDTRRYAQRCVTVNPGVDGFDAEQLIQLADCFAPPHDESALIYGSGIDTRPLLVERLARGRSLLGNPPATLNQINNPRNFFPLLARLGIPCPETRFAPPSGCEGWLVKPVCSEGGKGVGFCSKNRLTPNAYYQREVSGEAYSLLFLANGKTIRRIGFNTQWTSSHNPAQPFLFAGIINRAELTEAQRQSVERHAAQLTEATGLLGLNSLDFMLADGVCRVLENNPRPSASMALYDEDYAGGLLALHIAACRGDLPPQASAPSGPVRASRLVFCQAPVSIPVGFSWPKGCADIPAPRTKIEIGQPICRLQVETTSRPEAEALLQAQERDVQRGLDTRNDAAENAEMLAEVD